MLLLPVFTLAAAVVVDRAVVALGDPRFSISAIGSGWLMALVALLVVAVVVWVGALPALQPGTRQPIARAESWVRRSVPPGQVVLVDLATWPDLVDRHPGPDRLVRRRRRGAGAELGALVERRLPRHDRHGARRLDGRRLAGRPRPVAARRPVRRGLPRRWRCGPSAAPPLPAPSATPPTPAERRAADARKRTGAELAQNPRLTVDGPDRALLQGGEVDTRIAVVLGQLLAVHTVTIGGFPALAGDTGTVRRQAVISAIDGHPVPADADATGTVLRYLSSLRGDYATSTIDATDAGVLATFAPDPTFVPPS